MKRRASTTGKPGDDQTVPEAGGGRARWGELTWADLEAWAGARAVAKGRAYQRQGAVRALGMSTGGELVARVEGGSLYATRVRYEQSRRRRANRLASACSCPVARACKHAVATLVEALERIEAGEAIALVAADDARCAPEAGADEDDRRAAAPTRREIASYVRSLDREALVGLLLELCESHPNVGAEVEHRRAMAVGDASGVIRRLRSEIAAVSVEIGSRRSWSEEGETIDYARVRRGFERLLAAGHADEVVELGEELLRAGSLQFAHSHDGGEVALEIDACMGVVARALLASSRPDPDKLTYAIDVALRDTYELAAPVSGLADRRWSRRTWSAVADALAQRFASGAISPIAYARDVASHWRIEALERAGRAGEADEVCRDEATRTGSYLRLVDRLIATGRLDEANEWAERGYAALVATQAGTAAALRDRMQGIARKRRDLPLVAAYEAERFFENPALSTLAALSSAARKAGLERPVRAAALAFLESGRRPRASEGWPLPDVGLPSPPATRGFRPNETPYFEVLRDLAIAERRPDDILRWHDRLAGRSRVAFGARDPDLDVARAVAKTHPERALAIFLPAVAACIARADPRAYVEAGEILRNVRGALKAADREREWPVLLQGIRAEHRRKARLMDVLDGLERRRVAGRRKARRA